MLVVTVVLSVSRAAQPCDATSLPVQLERVGMQHQAGSDSLMTGDAFFKMKQVCTDIELEDGRGRSHLVCLILLAM